MKFKPLNYILGLDVGIASVGWAVVEIDEQESPIRLIDVGVRTFDKAEVPKTGESLALGRRLARNARRLIRRRAHRLLRAKRLLKREGVLTAADFDADGHVIPLKLDHQTLWDLRLEGLYRQLEPQEWARVLLHLIKHRGYLSQRKNEAKTTNKELGQLLSGVNQNHELLQAETYRTPAELAVKKFFSEEGHIRNQQGAYTHTFSRLDLQAELHLLFEKQRELKNPHATALLETAFDQLLMTQRDALSGDAVLKMLGKCTHEPEEYKAAKYSYSAERFVWLGKLNNLRILEQGAERPLTEFERGQLLELPYQKAKLTFAQVRKLLELSDNASFNLVRYGQSNNKSEVESKTTLVEMKAFHAIKKILKNKGLETEWAGLKTQPELLDAIGTAFSIYKTDKDISHYLASKLSPAVLDALLEQLNFDKFIQLSLKSLSKLLPLMEQGLRYDEACKEIYGDHYGHKNKEKHRILPQIPADEIRNPVVLRSLSQARKVINGIVRLYGSPMRVHIETGRELGKSLADRKAIEKVQLENQSQRESAVRRFKELFPDFIGEPKPKDVLKFRLYEQQQGKCLYSDKRLDHHKLFTNGYVEIDHALPLSRTWDDSFNNKVLVLVNENQNKRSQTPYEWLKGEENSQQWRGFVKRVQGSNFSPAKKQRLLTTEFDEEGFKERNLNDTRYVARFLCQYIEDNMLLVGKGKKRVFASNGRITALLRGYWGIPKSREENDRHHAVDAVVVACSTRSIQQKITHFFRLKEDNMGKGKHIIDRETGEIITMHFPEPWPYFRKDVLIRVFSDTPQEDLVMKLPSRPEANHEFVAPLFVSRTPNRKMTGQGHMETIKSAKRLEEGISVMKIPLTQLKLSDLENMVNRKREEKLYDDLKTCLEAFDNDPGKAFAEPFYKKGGQIVKSVRVEKIQKSGVIVRNGHGVADNASMVRVDVFIKNGKYFLVPIYTWQAAKGILPNKAVIAGKDEDEWEEMDEHAQFQFSMYSNDLIRIQTKKETILGYYMALDRSTGSISIREHDNNINKGKNGIYRIGVKTAISLTKYHVDELGKNIYPCRVTKRQNVR